MPHPARPAQTQFEVLYRAHGLSPVRMVSIVASAFAVGGLAFAYQLLQAPVVGPQAPASRPIAAIVVAVMAVGGFFATWLYARRIAARVAVSADGKTLRVAQPTPFGTDERDIPVADIVCAGLQAGDGAGEETLAGSSLRVNVRGQRGFIVPLGGRAGAPARLLEVLQVSGDSPLSPG